MKALAALVFVAAYELAVPGLPGQPQPLPAPAFEVASIGLHHGDIVAMGGALSGPRIRLVAVSLTDLISAAYHRDHYQISGAQHWMDSEHYDVLANAPAGAATDETHVRPMFQALLADRFQLKVHREMRTTPVYALVVTKQGLKIKPSTQPEFSMGLRGNTIAHAIFVKADMERFASWLTYGAGRPVLDRTGLTGSYDFTLDWSPDFGGARPPDPGAAELFTALQEQLGLKLELRKEPLEFIVIDHAERPSEN